MKGHVVLLLSAPYVSEVAKCPSTMLQAETVFRAAPSNIYVTRYAKSIRRNMKHFAYKFGTL